MHNSWKIKNKRKRKKLNRSRLHINHFNSIDNSGDRIIHRPLQFYVSLSLSPFLCLSHAIVIRFINHCWTCKVCEVWVQWTIKQVVLWSFRFKRFLLLLAFAQQSGVDYTRKSALYRERGETCNLHESGVQESVGISSARSVTRCLRGEVHFHLYNTSRCCTPYSVHRARNSSPALQSDLHPVLSRTSRFSIKFRV